MMNNDDFKTINIFLHGTRHCAVCAHPFPEQVDFQSLSNIYYDILLLK